MKKIITTNLLVFGLFLCFSQTHKTIRLTPEEFVIMPYDWTPGSGDLSTLKDIYDCGFNLAGFAKPGALKNVSEAGLKAIVYDDSAKVDDATSRLNESEISKRVKVIAEKTAENNTVFGYYLRDEPGSSIFQGLKSWKDAWAKAAPKSLAYINLFPVYASSDKQLQAKDYEDYLEKYVSVVKPEFISYDNYSLMSDGSIRKGYFENLGAVRAIALKNNIPFWNNVLANSHFNYCDPSYPGLCFQLYTSLAYGAQGIGYFTYFDRGRGNYRYAAIDQFGRKTPTWFILQNINSQLHAIGKAYIKLKSVHVFHSPKSEECEFGLESSHFLSSLTGDNLLVGEFEDAGKTPFIIVVNKSLVKSQPFDLSFKEHGTVYQINNYTGEAELWSGENNWLAPGQGRILFVKK
jgi:hypothetical protein